MDVGQSEGAASRVSWQVAPSPSQQYAEPRPSMVEQILTTRKNLLHTLATNDERKIAVYLRIRPSNSSEIDRGASSCIQAVTQKQVTVAAPSKSNSMNRYRNNQQSIDFTFTRVFDEDVSQTTFFNETSKSLTDEVLAGNNSLIFSYGMTSSGKTHTIQGSNEDPGVLPRALNSLFERINAKGTFFNSDEEKYPLFKPEMSTWVRQLSKEQAVNERLLRKKLQKLAAKQTDISAGGLLSRNLSSSSNRLEDIGFGRSRVSFMAASSSAEADDSPSDCHYSVWVSFYEIYKEGVFDLLTPMADPKSRPQLKVSHEQDESCYVAGVRWVYVKSANEALRLLVVGQRNLQFAATKLNYNSSRSHGIFTVRVLKLEMDNSTGSPTPLVTGCSNLCICDLAGSERGCERSDEAGKINTSLLCLSRCLQMIRKQQNTSSISTTAVVAPFRESKLTLLLKDYLTGRKGRTRMVVNICKAADMFNETLHVLRFSAVARRVRSEYRGGGDVPNVIGDTSLVNGDTRRDRRRCAVTDTIKEENERRSLVDYNESSSSAGDETMSDECGDDIEEPQLQPETNEDDEEETVVGGVGVASQQTTIDWYQAQLTELTDKLQQERQRNLQMESDLRKEICDEFAAQMEKQNRRRSLLYREERARAEDLQEGRLMMYVKSERERAARQRQMLIDRYERGDISRQDDGVDADDDEIQWVASHDYEEEKKARREAEQQLESALAKIADLESRLLAEGAKAIEKSAADNSASKSDELETMKEELENAKQSEKDALEMLQEASETFQQQQQQIEQLKLENERLAKQPTEVPPMPTTVSSESQTDDNTTGAAVTIIATTAPLSLQTSDADSLTTEPQEIESRQLDDEQLPMEEEEQSDATDLPPAEPTTTASKRKRITTPASTKRAKESGTSRSSESTPCLSSERPSRRAKTMAMGALLTRPSVTPIAEAKTPAGDENTPTEEEERSSTRQARKKHLTRKQDAKLEGTPDDEETMRKRMSVDPVALVTKAVRTKKR